MADNSFGIKELNLVGSGTPKIQSPNNINLEAVTVAISTNATVGGTLNVGGVITGDGSGLTGVVGSGSGVVIKHDGATVGTAGTIDFSTNLDVSAISGAAVTITASGGGIGTDGSINTTGIITASQFHATDKINVGTGATIEANGQASFAGIITASNGIFIPESERLTLGSGGQDFRIYNDSKCRIITAQGGDIEIGGTTDAGNNYEYGFRYVPDNQVELTFNGYKKFETTNFGISVTGNVISDATVSAANKITVGSGATIDASGQAIFTGIITSKSSIKSDGGNVIVDIGSLNQGFYLKNGNSTHLGISWSSSASRNYFSGNSGGNHPLTFEDFSAVTMETPLSISGDFKVGTGVTIQSGGSANFVGVITAGNVRTTSSITCGSDITIHGNIRRGSSGYSFIEPGNNPNYYAGTVFVGTGDHIFKTFNSSGSNYEVFRIGSSCDIGILGENYGTSGQVLTSGGAGSAVSWTTVSGGVGNDGSINTTGIITAASFSGVGNDIVTARWTLGANGTSDFTFTGPGFPTTQNDPVIYLARGQTYEFENNSGGSHPFQIQDSENTPYTTGVTYPNGGSSATSGITTFAVPFTASNSLQYKCTSHGNMGNTIVIYPNLNV